MPKIIPPGFIDCSILIERTGDPNNYVTTFGAQIGVAPFTQQNAVALGNRIGTELDDLLITTERIVGLNVRVGTDGAPLVRQVPLDVPGISTAQRLPQNCAVIVNKLSELGGRRNRGRMFWPSIGETSVDDTGNITIGSRDTFQARFDALLSALRGEGALPPNTSNMVILHSSGVAAPTVVSGLRVERLIGTQRRRLRR